MINFQDFKLDEGLLEMLRCTLYSAIASILVILLAYFYSQYIMCGLLVTLPLLIFCSIKAQEEFERTQEPKKPARLRYEEYTPESLALVRKEGLQMMANWYCDVLAEDPQDGSNFDNDVLDALALVKKKWCDKNPVTGDYLPVRPVDYKEII